LGLRTRGLTDEQLAWGSWSWLDGMMDGRRWRWLERRAEGVEMASLKATRKVLYTRRGGRHVHTAKYLVPCKRMLFRRRGERIRRGWLPGAGHDAKGRASGQQQLRGILYLSLAVSSAPLLPPNGDWPVPTTSHPAPSKTKLRAAGRLNVCFDPPCPTRQA
jgi:hypothetical protein